LQLTRGISATTIQVEVNFKSRVFSMDIAEVAKRTGVPASTLRYYEKRGLIASLAPQGTRRRFGPAVLDQLALVALGQAAGLSLDEVRSMLSPAGRPNIDRKLLAAKASELDTTIRQLSAVRRGLRHAAVCPARSHADCPTFKKLLKAAASGALDHQQRNKELQPTRKAAKSTLSRSV
jgi:DNA-binding transcriptional MerR regulator